jgi:hypothetical protein
VKRRPTLQASESKKGLSGAGNRSERRYMLAEMLDGGNEMHDS